MKSAKTIFSLLALNAVTQSALLPVAPLYERQCLTECAAAQYEFARASGSRHILCRCYSHFLEKVDLCSACVISQDELWPLRTWIALLRYCGAREDCRMATSRY